MVEDILERYSQDLGPDRSAYCNHVARVLNYCQVLFPDGVMPDQILIAAAFHDLGIWTDGTFDYLEPSIRLAGSYLETTGESLMESEVRAIIEFHHKTTRYRGPFASTVEIFRRGDLVDVSLGAIRFGIPRSYVRAVKKALSNTGFHRRLVQLTLRQFVRDPLHPLPMMRW